MKPEKVTDPLRRFLENNGMVISEKGYFLTRKTKFTYCFLRCLVFFFALRLGAFARKQNRNRFGQEADYNTVISSETSSQAFS